MMGGYVVKLEDESSMAEFYVKFAGPKDSTTPAHTPLCPIKLVFHIYATVCDCFGLNL